MLIQIKQVKSFSRAGWRQAVVCVCYLLICVLLISTTLGCQDNGSAVIVTGEAAEQEMSTDQHESTAKGELSSVELAEGMTVGESEEVSLICVHVCGKVLTPGVYYLTTGSRVWDAIEMAGGLLSEAASEAVNLAMIVADGSKVTIPDKEEAVRMDFRWYETDDGKVLTIGGAAVGGSYYDDREENAGSDEGITADRVNINRADVAALMTIPGIGQARAEAIVSYRETRGPFGNIEEIMRVTGIKDGLFAKIKEYITVGG